MRPLFRTHGFPVVEGLIAVGDVAEQSRTESGREQTFECSGAFRSPNLPSTTDWAVKKKTQYQKDAQLEITPPNNYAYVHQELKKKKYFCEQTSVSIFRHTTFNQRLICKPCIL